jgi:hypothetical protein
LRLSCLLLTLGFKYVSSIQPRFRTLIKVCGFSKRTKRKGEKDEHFSNTSKGSFSAKDD